MPQAQVTLNPDLFDESDWRELHYAAGIPNRDTRPEQSLQVSRSTILEAIQECRNKAQSLDDGFSGESDEDVDVNEWAGQLRSIATRLEDLIA